MACQVDVYYIQKNCQVGSWLKDSGVDRRDLVLGYKIESHQLLEEIITNIGEKG